MHLNLKGHIGNINCLQFTNYDRYLYSGEEKGILYRWDLKDGKRKDILTKEKPISHLFYSKLRSILFITFKGSQNFIQLNSNFKKLIK